MYRLIPVHWDIRPIISHGKGQCLSEVKEDPKVKPEALPRQNETLTFPKEVLHPTEQG